VQQFAEPFVELGAALEQAQHRDRKSPGCDHLHCLADGNQAVQG
jgi:hypothetical protein